MSKHLQSIQVHVRLTPYGDALLFGRKQAYGYEPGLYLKQLLFAWHEESFYGTELEIQQAEGADIIVLPAEQVIPYLADDAGMLQHVEWEWDEESRPLKILAPALAACIGQRKYHPSLEVYRQGKLQWVWEEGFFREQLTAAIRGRGAGLEGAGARSESVGADAEGVDIGPKGAGAGSESVGAEAKSVGIAEAGRANAGGADAANAAGADFAGQVRAALQRLAEDDELREGLQAAFSAAVWQRWYSTEEEAADLRSEFPRLFERGAARFAGMNEQAWLVAVGWKADTAPFRPILQLLEPEEAAPEWRLQLNLQDKHDASSLYPVQLADSGEAAGSWPSEWTAHVRERSAGWLDRLRAGMPPGRLAAGSDVLGRALDNDAAWQFLRQDSEQLLKAGWLVLLPAWWEAASRRKPRLRAKVRAASEEEKSARGPSYFGFDSLVDFDWRVAIGDTDLSESEFQELLARNERLVQFRGQWLALDPDFLAQIRRAMDSINPEQGLSFQDVLQLHLLEKRKQEWNKGETSGEPEDDSSKDEEDSGQVRIEVELNGLLARLFSQLNRQEDWPLEPVPGNLHATLRSYQHAGFAWLAFLRRYGLGGILADDMGLGKTVQLIAYLLHVKESRAAGAGEAARRPGQTERSERLEPLNRLEQQDRLVQTEGPEWSERSEWPRGSEQPVHHARPERSELPARPGLGPASRTRSPALVICPTSVLGNWQKELQRFAPSLSVKLHYGSGRLSGEAFEAETLQADVVLTSYATAALDQELLQTVTWESICLDEAQNIKNAQTKQSAAVRSFPARHRIALTGTPIENRLSELWSIYDFIAPGYLGSARAFQHRFAAPIEKDHDEKRMTDLKKLVHPFLLRRKKKDPAIQLDLPEKNEMKTYVNLTAEQGALYDQAVSQLMQQMASLKGIQRKGAILSALTHLKQLCNHPLLAGSEPSPGMNGEPVEDADIAALVERSSKLERLLAMVKELREEGERCLIFTQYIGMGEMLKTVLEHELQEPVLYLNGSTSKTARDRMVEQFQSGAGADRAAESGAAAGAAKAGASGSSKAGSSASPAVFILSLKAGGVGLNLTAANHVFHFDRWWNPAVENQATDRAYRMGQTKDVQVHKFICLGTLEERIDEMLESKQQLSDNVISSTEGWITELSTEDLRELITLRRDWA
ncbi:DEAD/DEAH box helicase [Paenibacillus pinistramenti]|uniref:DEAD/DEAH box helicase n=1 Tax=Paenibacillus pinistramenti TaxID=1768003 RepID=UPI001EF1306F|nr:DEAD/DEAH box helicase [Paenibacillus pinistramenti]